MESEWGHWHLYQCTHVRTHTNTCIYKPHRQTQNRQISAFLKTEPLFFACVCVSMSRYVHATCVMWSDPLELSHPMWVQEMKPRPSGRAASKDAPWQAPSPAQHLGSCGFFPFFFFLISGPLPVLTKVIRWGKKTKTARLHFRSDTVTSWTWKFEGHYLKPSISPKPKDNKDSPKS